MNSQIGTPNFRAPELVWYDEEKGYLTGVDIWAVGCLIFETMTLKSLFRSSNDSDLAKEILNLFGTEKCKGIFEDQNFTKGYWMQYRDLLLSLGYSE